MNVLRMRIQGLGFTVGFGLGDGLGLGLGVDVF
jgi:hypothetical protein